MWQDMTESTSSQKGKLAELLVFRKLVGEGADLYLPAIDIGIDAIIRKKDGKHIELQVKSTTAESQAGCFNIYDLEEHDQKYFYIVCVDLSSDPPKTWILPNQIFKDHATITTTKEGWKRYMLDINARDKKHNNEKRSNLLKNYQEAWELLTK